MTTKRRTREAPRHRLTDVGNSLRFTADHANKLIYVPGPGWHFWDGKRWKIDNESAPYRAAKETAFRIRQEAGQIEDRDVAAKVFAWATKSESAARIKSMVDLAKRGERNTRGLLADLARLDSEAHLLSCENGTLDLKTGRLRPHDPEDYLTRLVPVQYQPGAKAPRWEKFLGEVLEDDQGMIAYVQRAVGYSLTGENSEQVMFLAHGKGSNGKTTFMETIAEIAGEWAVNAAADTFVSAGRSAGTGVPNDLARMRGARLVRVPETEDGTTLARQIVKRITGGDTITARFMYREWFEYLPAFKIWLVTNHLPSIPFTDWAAWRRIHVIPFRRRFEGREQQPFRVLRAELREELPGILAWAVSGAREWYRNGGLGTVPMAAQLARDEYHARQDTTGRFLKDETLDDADANMPRSQLYDEYQGWCRDEGLPPNSRTAFYRAISERGYATVKDRRGNRSFRGIRLQ